MVLSLTAAAPCSAALPTFVEPQVEGAMQIDTTLAARADSLRARADALIAPFVDARDFVGTVLVARGHRVLLRKSYGGGAGVQHQDPSLRYGIGSLTKTFTAAMVLRLADSGRLALDDPVMRYLPEALSDSAVTIAHLLGHTAGVSDIYRWPEYAERHGDSISLAAIAAAAHAKPLDFRPGSASAYSNTGYALLALLVERLTKRSFGDALRTELLDPLGMRCTGDRLGGRLGPRDAMGYDPGFPPVELTAARQVHPSWLVGSGSLFACADDLLRWSEAVREDRPVRVATAGVPYGWSVRTRWEHRVLEQTGRVPTGYASYLAVYLDADVVVVVLDAVQADVAERIGIALAGLVLGAPTETPAARPATTPLASRDAAGLAAFVGTYQVGPGFVLTVQQTPQGVSLASPDRVFLPLTPIGPSRFFFRPLYVPVTFLRDSTGRVTAFDWGGQFRGERVAP